MTGRSSLTGNLLLLTVTVLLFFGSIEIALRVTGIDKGMPKTPPIYQKSADPALSYELKPNLNETAFRSTVVTDRRGFRSEEVHPGKQTIVLLGDSISFGYGLENDQMIGARMSDVLNGEYNVVTAAVPGFSLGQEAALFKNNVAVLHPSTLILQFHWNDLTDNPPDVLDDDGNLRAAGWTSDTPRCNPIMTGILSLVPGKCWLDLHSAFYRTVKKAVMVQTEQKNLHDQETEYRQNAFGDDVTDEQLAHYGNTLGAFAATLPRTLKKLFVIWPEKRLHLEATQELRDIAERRGFRVLNLYEVFGNKAESLSWDTVHPSATTAEEAATVIAAALREWNLLPQ